MQGVLDAAGLAGQNNANPPGLFVSGDHALVTYTSPTTRQTVIYDPSYGSGPFASVRAWADASLAGFATLNELNGNIALEACSPDAADRQPHRVRTVIVAVGALR